MTLAEFLKQTETCVDQKLDQFREMATEHAELAGMEVWRFLGNALEPSACPACNGDVRRQKTCKYCATLGKVPAHLLCHPMNLRD